MDAVDVRHGYVRAADVTITEFDVSGATSTSPYAISPDGTVTGWYDDAVGSHGFVRDPSGIITVFDVPGGVSNTFPSGITPLGQIEGNYADTKGVNHGFLGYAGCPFTTLDVPSGAGTGANQGTIPNANNNPGAISGVYIDTNNAYHGFVRSQQGTISTFDVANAGNGALIRLAQSRPIHWRAARLLGTDTRPSRAWR